MGLEMEAFGLLVSDNFSKRLLCYNGLVEPQRLSPAF